MDFVKKCAIIMIAWSKKGKRALITVPKTRVKTMTILRTVSSMGVVNIKLN